MTNQQVINAFVSGKSGKSSNGNLYVSCDKTRLFNYGTCIAQRLSDGTFVVNSTKYSVTTSKIQTYVRYTIGNYTEVFGKPRGTSYLA